MSRDTLSELLRVVRLRGAIFYYVEGIAPWVAETPHAREIVAAILPGAEHIMEYHVVTRGVCWGGLTGEAPVQLQAGDVILFPQGDAHVMSSAPGLRVTRHDHSDFFSPRPSQLPYVLTQHGDTSSMTARLDGGGEDHATIVCGFLGCDARPFNPLLAALPRLLHMPGAAARSVWMGQFIQAAVQEANDKRPGGEVMLERLSEMMFVDVVRRYLNDLPPGQTGWLAGLRDRFVGRALALLHERPSHAWTIDELSDAAGLSRSALHERFVRFVGEPPMQYLAHWRMQVASQLLLQSTQSVASIAGETGYDSEAAFSRARARPIPCRCKFRISGQELRPIGHGPCAERTAQLRASQSTGTRPCRSWTPADSPSQPAIANRSINSKRRSRACRARAAMRSRASRWHWRATHISWPVIACAQRHWS